MNLADPGLPEFILVVAAGVIAGLAVHRQVEIYSKEKAERMEKERLAKKQDEALYLWLNKEEE